TGRESAVLGGRASHADGQGGGALAGAGRAPLADDGPLEDRLVAGVAAFHPVLVGQAALGHGQAPARHRRPPPQWGAEPLGAVHAVRSQATGWPSRTRSPAWASKPMRKPRNGLQTGVEWPTPSTKPITCSAST